MNNPIDEISIADQLLKQLEDQYLAVHSQNIVMPQQNTQPQQDPQNPYQPLQFEDEQDSQQDQQNQQQIQENDDHQENYQEEHIQADVQSFKKQIQSLRIQQSKSNPEIKELIQVSPVDEKIFTDLPVKDFDIDQQKIKTFALSMEINQPHWLKDQSLCKVRIQELFIKKSFQKPFTKI